MSETAMNLTNFGGDMSSHMSLQSKYNPSSYPNTLNPTQKTQGYYEDYVDIIIIFLPKYEKEFIQNIRVLRNHQGDIDLYELLKTLKDMEFPIGKNVISYYSYSNDMYVYCGNDPLAPGTYLPAMEVANVDETKQITIRVRPVISNYSNLETVPDTDNVKLEGSVNFEGEGAGGTKQKRTKERKIGEILDKVLQWRRLYTGVSDPATGQTIKMSLDEAAQRVGISKKSLDDYLLQIRFGKKYGFNFNDHFNERVGVLRTFVKKHKGKKNEKKEEGVDDFDDGFGEDTGRVKVETLPMSKRSKKI